MTTWTVWFTAVLAAFASITQGIFGTGLHIRRNIAVLPHDTYPGFSIKKYDAGDLINFRMLETGFSQFFTVLDNGMVMTTSDISPLVNRAVNLVVLEEMPNKTATHSLHLYVLDREDMLSFREELYEGEILENSPSGTLVSRLPRIQAYGGGTGGVKYSLVEGNDDGAFRLKPEKYNATYSGVRLVTNFALDREKEAQRLLTVQAMDGRGIDKAYTKVKVNILDENDNSPVFKQQVYGFTLGGNGGNNLINSTWRKFKVIGKVSATDADGDKVAFRLLTPSNVVVLVPQTGEILLTGDPSVNPGELRDLELRVEAHDVRIPSRISEVPARIWLRYNASYNDNNMESNEIKHREKRRVTRAVRPTKRIEFTEADGETEGRIVFQLEKETERETFKIRDENAWVTVEPNGSVRVKKKWDYEELGPEKTIDFWVTITNNGNGGE
ncbi:hypothetical protein RUM43_009167 [Polyplax serrata]|uniref:Cadherin domain-containing protein n=1 Tax=Polyplax serrata TaxID=468196 RepID=A0AAN8S4C1_POLSC